MTGERERLAGDGGIFRHLRIAMADGDTEAVENFEARGDAAARPESARTKPDTSPDSVPAWILEGEAATTEEEARRIWRAARAVGVSLADVSKKLPEAVIWQDVPPEADDYQSPVLPVGEVALLAGAGEAGKSTLAMSLAMAAHTNPGRGEADSYGRACGLRVKRGPVAFLSYEDVPGALGQIADMYGTEDRQRHIEVFPNPVPLWSAIEGDGWAPAKEDGWWRPFWDHVAAHGSKLVIIDPVSVAFAGANPNDGAAVRAFLAAVRGEVAAIGAGALLLAHDTKGTRTDTKAGGDPGAGAVSGSSQWSDGARGALHLTRFATRKVGPAGGRKGDENGDQRILECVKANYARGGWGALIQEQDPGPRDWAGIKLGAFLVTKADVMKRRRELARAAHGADNGNGDAKGGANAGGDDGLC